MDDKITIDKETLKAIASDTRLDILKQLDKKKHTLSDLSKSLKLSGPTIKEHLDVLSNAGLVRKEDSLRKWKYYSLTFKGKGLLRPNETKLFLTLLITIIVGLGAFIILGLFSGMGSSMSRSSNQENAVMMSTSLSDNAVMVPGESQNVETIDAEIRAQSTGTNTKEKITETVSENTINNETGQTNVENELSKPIDNTKKPLFEPNYIFLTIVILILFIIFILYINEKKKR